MFLLFNYIKINSITYKIIIIYKCITLHENTIIIYRQYWYDSINLEQFSTYSHGSTMNSSIVYSYNFFLFDLI